MLELLKKLLVGFIWISVDVLARGLMRDAGDGQVALSSKPVGVLLMQI